MQYRQYIFIRVQILSGICFAVEKDGKVCGFLGVKENEQQCRAVLLAGGGILASGHHAKGSA
ncbi:MAG: hypothetical protein ACLT16_10465 [[Clostridium] innocuum]